MAEVAEKTRKKSSKTDYDKDTYLKWFTTMFRIRKFEERALLMYSKQKIRGFCHVYIGQEAVAAGMETALKQDDALVTAYRQHGIALMKGLSADECMAELFGKKTGAVKGKGGSMHFFSAEHRYFGGNGIVGAQIPIGTGMALAEKYRKSDLISITMFGDGAARQGSLHESFNMAMTWKLPVLYVCENNGYAMGTSVSRTSNVEDLYKLGLSYDMPSESVDGMDPVAVHEAFKKAAEHVRSGKGPYYLEVKTYRYKGHSVSDPAKYRSKDELKAYMDKDPIKMLEAKIIDNKIATEDELDDIKSKIKAEIDKAVEFADNSEYPAPEALFEDNYLQEDYPYMKD